MSMLSRFRRKRRYAALTDEERIGRYVYLLNTLPASVIETAHAAAFKDVPAQRRREMFEQLRPFMSEKEQAAASDDPTVLAKLVRRAEERRAQRAAAVGGATGGGAAPVATATRGDLDPRDAVDSRELLLTSGVALVVAHNFLMSSAVVTYFAMGGGSLAIASEPAWVGETYDSGAAAGFGGGDYGGGGGYDGGGFGGGFDGGGFGGFGGDGGGGGFGG